MAKGIEKVEVLKTLKCGKGREHTYFRGRILEGDDITHDIRTELAQKPPTGTLRVLNGLAGRSSNSSLTTVENGIVFENGVPIGKFTPMDSKVAVEEEKTEKTDSSTSESQGAPTRRSSVANQG